MGIRKPRNSIQHVWIAKVSLCYSFLSIHIIWEPTRYGLEEKTEILILSLYFMSNWNGKVLRFYSDTRASLPLLARALNSHFKVFLRSGRRKTGNCSFTGVATPNRGPRDRDGGGVDDEPPLVLIVRYVNFPQVSAVRIPHTLIEHLYRWGSV